MSAVPSLPWLMPHPAAPGTSAHVLATRLEVRSFWNVPRFLLKSLLVWLQVRRAAGALGVSLDAQLPKKVFYTLSVWESREALHTFVGTEPPRSVMSALRPTMKAGTFTFWELPVEQLPPDWRDARRRVDEQARLDAGS